ncbi:MULTISPECIES: transglutaminase family protein [Caulobacter]|uniref:Transglutaminase-like enzyme, predicted cysteine protease n=1 Tax=Caulobacter vibrioides OR37 TaxID=1292034 RepID=R0EJT1_CAUVI|nr:MULTISPECIES: transglutaminase family protein [Caulobacter]ENZ81412.1 transglutaminase-like enzyme, predicted cysteine protease [Caulobacter vibrioides OR37]MBQ1560665.1 transglutaminase family protein [Caulobacter sp.]
MLLEIRHVTQYHYERPVRESLMELWMQPQKTARQRLVSFELDIEPAAQLFSYADSFGNAVYHFDVPQPHDKLTIIARSAVETEAPPERPAHLDMGEWDRLRSEFVRGECFDFLRPHGFVETTDALRAFVANHDLDALKRKDPLTAVRVLSETIYGAFEYQPGVTDADSPIDLALGVGRGVCQDFAHIMLAICRDWGVPARYVSGYLFTDRDQGDRSDPDATHAWVEVFLPSLRWVGFDPTNNMMAGERHVAVAVGRDYADVTPSRGVYKGDSESQLAVGVSVRRARAAVAEPEFMRMARPNFAGGRRRPDAALREDLHQQQQQQQQ